MTEHDKAMNDEQLPAILMPLFSTSDCDLHCGEDSSEVITGDSPEYSSDLDSLSSSLPLSSLLTEEEEESITVFIEDEHKFVPGLDYVSRFQSRSLEASTREEAIAWILKVNINSVDESWLTPLLLLLISFQTELLFVNFTGT